MVLREGDIIVTTMEGKRVEVQIKRLSLHLEQAPEIRVNYTTRIDESEPSVSTSDIESFFAWMKMAKWEKQENKQEGSGGSMMFFPTIST